MSPFWGRIIRRTLAVGIVLAVIGFVLAKAFLMAHRVYSGGAYDAENERVLWQTPLTMALIGMLFSGGTEFLIGLVRKPAPVPIQPPSDDDVRT